MFVCRLVISVQGVIAIDLFSLGCIVPEILKSIKNTIMTSKLSRAALYYVRLTTYHNKTMKSTKSLRYSHSFVIIFKEIK